MPKPNRIIYPPDYWLKKIWDMQFWKLPDFRVTPFDAVDFDVETEKENEELLRSTDKGWW